LIAGDFNYNLAQSDNLNVSNFVELMFDNFYKPVISKPTRISRSSTSIIDHIWTNMHEYPLKSGSILSLLSDNLSVFMCVNFNQ